MKDFSCEMTNSYFPIIHEFELDWKTEETQNGRKKYEIIEIVSRNKLII